MEIKVRFFNILKNHMGTEGKSVELEQGEDVYDLIGKLDEKSEVSIKEQLLAPSGEIKPYIKIYRNDNLLMDYQNSLQDGDTVKVFLAAVGG